MKKRIVIAGSTQLAERLVEHLSVDQERTVVGYVDDFEPVGTMKHGRPILGAIADLPGLHKEKKYDAVLMGIGYRDRKFRQQVFDYINGNGIPVMTYIHPTAYVEESASIGKGSIILSQALIDVFARIGENVIVSNGVFVSHHVRIQSHCYCSARTNIAGRSQIGERCFLGINTTVVDNLTIGSDVTVAAGSVVTRDIPAGVLAAGVPAVVKKRSVGVS